MITRDIIFKENKKTKNIQKGQGNKDESLKRLLWYAKYHLKTFYNVLYLLPLVGSWKDIFKLTFMLHENNINFSYIKFFEIINNGLTNDSQKDLVKKYLPRIRSNQKCKTNWSLFTNNFAKDFAKYNKISIQEYRKLKSDGNAHIFQKLICKKDYYNLNFNTISGKVLLKLTTGNFVKKHNLLEKLIE